MNTPLPQYTAPSVSPRDNVEYSFSETLGSLSYQEAGWQSVAM